MARRKEVDLGKIKAISIKQRKNKVFVEDFAELGKGSSFKAFWNSLPGYFAAEDIKRVVTSIRKAKEKDKPVIWFMGAHVIKVGLSPMIIDLMKRGFVSAIGLNGAGSIHDVEIAMIGQTSEDVGMNISDGTFGMVKETSDFINSCVNAGVLEGLGFGESVGRQIESEKLKYRNLSLLASAYRLDIPVTVHIAIGTDIIQVHPSFDGACTGEASARDFRIMANNISRIGNGGVIMNVGSAVILPLIVEKSLSIAHNLGKNVNKFTGVNLDFVQHYRSNLNPVKRAKEHGGDGISITGHHELTIPLIYWALRTGADLK
ncbi:MAG TPA: hypothetical protein PLN69_03300 [bacterium]|nr:hypothetical protein [bacterium]